MFFILYTLIDYPNNTYDLSTLLWIIIQIFLLGFLLSIPSFILYYISYIIFRKFLETFKSIIYIKLALTLIAILCMFLTFLIFAGEAFTFREYSVLLIPYAIAIFIAGQMLKIVKSKNNSDYYL